MPVTVEVLDPVEGEEVRFKLTWTNDLEIGPVHLDDIESGAPRHAIAFFRPSDGNREMSSSRIIGTTMTQQRPPAAAHTFTAIAVVGDKVVAKDRKRVRSGSVVP